MANDAPRNELDDARSRALYYPTTPLAEPEETRRQVEELDGNRAPLRVLWRAWEHGPESLTDEEKELLAAWHEAELRRAEERELVGLVDLAEVMEQGVQEPVMLLDDWLVRGEHHVVYGEAGVGKTWVVLAQVAALLMQGENVVWVDLEMGRRLLAERLHLLGVRPDTVRDHLTYLEYPGFDLPRGRPQNGETNMPAMWAALLDQYRPALVVWDAQTGALAAADVDENRGTDVARWQRAYVEPARRVGAAVVLIDHTPLNGEGRPVASRQKGAAAKVMYAVTGKKAERPTRDRVGTLAVECTKNGPCARVPEKRQVRLGFEDGRFVYEENATPFADAPDATPSDFFEVRERVVEALRRANQPLTRRAVRDLVGVGDAKVQTALDSMIKEAE